MDRPSCQLLRRTLDTCSAEAIKHVMVQAMPIMAAPRRKKDILIEELMTYARGSDSSHARVCKGVLALLTVPAMKAAIRSSTLGGRLPSKRADLIAAFISASLGVAAASQPASSSSTQPFNPGVAASSTDIGHRELVVVTTDAGKLRKRLGRMWEKAARKAARFSRRQTLSRKVVKALKAVVGRGSGESVKNIRDKVSKAAGVDLTRGHARAFFERQLTKRFMNPKKKRRLASKKSALPKVWCRLDSNPVRERQERDAMDMEDAFSWVLRH